MRPGPSTGTRTCLFFLRSELCLWPVGGGFERRDRRGAAKNDFRLGTAARARRGTKKKEKEEKAEMKRSYPANSNILG